MDPEEHDPISDVIEQEGITAVCERIDVRPDVTIQEQEQWKKQDPEYPPEHYRCVLRRGDQEMIVYQSVGADYPDEDEEEPRVDLYADVRVLLLSPEFLLESAALKAYSVESAASLEAWIEARDFETDTPELTFKQYQETAADLHRVLGDPLYDLVIQLAVDADADDDIEEEYLL